MRASPKSDPQREEVYNWEAKFENTARSVMTKRRFHTLARDISNAYNLPVPEIKGQRNQYAAVCWPNGVITFDKGYRSAMTLCHEMAHYILGEFGYTQELHGPLWLSLYLRLLDTHAIIPFCASGTSARKAGLKFRPLAQSAPDVLQPKNRVVIQV